MQNTKNISYSIIIFLAITLLMILKLGFFRNEIFGEVSLFRLLFIEFPVWMFFPAVIFYLLKRISIPFTLFYNVLASFLMVSIIWYDRYFLTIPSYFDLKQTGQAGSIMETVNLLYSPWDFLFFADILVYVILWSVYRKRLASGISRKLIGSVTAVLLLLTAATSVIALQKQMLDVALFAKEQGFFQTQIAQAYQKNRGTAFSQENILSPVELEALKGNEFVEYSKHDRFGIAEGRHLFVIQVESLQGFAINQQIEGQELTPNINDLLQDSIYFDKMFQQIGAGNTSDAEWLLHTSLYPKGLEATVNFLNGEKVPSLVSLLNDRKYYTTTYHADKIEYWNRNVLYPTLGFQKHYSLPEIPEEDIIGFGPSDRVMFEFAENEISKQIEEGKTIYANLMTLTSHTPFQIPEEEKLLKLPDHFEGTYTGDYLHSVRYADEEIGKFISFLKEEGIYEESLIVINGDHSGLHGTPMTVNDTNLMTELIGHDYTIKDRFLLPFIITGPGLFEHETNSNFGGQIDMMPTIMNLLGIVPEMPIIGHNMLEYEKNLLTMRYYLSGGSLMTGEEIYLGANARYPERYYEFKTMERLEVPEKIEDMQTDSQAILDYSDSLLNRYLNELEENEKTDSD